MARQGTAPWRLAQRRRDETKGPWGPGGRTESDRGHQKGGVASPSGNRTPVSRVTGGDTHHYTNEDGGDRPTARPLTGSRAACRRVPLPSTGPRPPRVPTQPRTQPTASVTAAARHPDRAPDPRGTGHAPVRAASCLQRGHSAGRRGPEKESQAARTRWARAGRRPARRGAAGEGPARPGPGWVRGATCGRRAPTPSTPTPDGRLPACLPACLAACRGAARGPPRAPGLAPRRVPARRAATRPARPAVRMAERSKALRSGRSLPWRRGFESHS